MSILKKNIYIEESFFELLGFGLLRKGNVPRRFEGFVSFYWLDDKTYFYEVTSDVSDRLTFTSKGNIPLLHQYVIIEYKKKIYKRLNSLNRITLYSEKKKLPGLRKFLLLKKGVFNSFCFFGNDNLSLFKTRTLINGVHLVSYKKGIKQNLGYMEYNVSFNGFIFIFIKKNLLLRGSKGSSLFFAFKKLGILSYYPCILSNNKSIFCIDILYNYFQYNVQISQKLFLKLKILVFYLSFLCRFIWILSFSVMLKSTFLYLKGKLSFSDAYKELRWATITKKKTSVVKPRFIRRRRRRYFVKIFKRVRNPFNNFIKEGLFVLNNGFFLYYISYLFNFLFKSLLLELRLFSILYNLEKKKKVFSESCPKKPYINSSLKVNFFALYIELYNMFTKLFIHTFNIVVCLFWFAFVIVLFFEKLGIFNSFFLLKNIDLSAKFGVNIPYVKNKYKGLWELYSLPWGKQLVILNKKS